MKISKKLTSEKVLTGVLAVLAALAGLLLAGCDGASGETGPVRDAGTGEVQGNPCAGPSVVVVQDVVENNVLVSPAQQAMALCAGTASMTAAQCSDAGHDYVDSAGVKHSFTLRGDSYAWYLASFIVMPTTCASWDAICANGVGQYATYLGKHCH
jgi:hypothetical protein